MIVRVCRRDRDVTVVPDSPDALVDADAPGRCPLPALRRTPIALVVAGALTISLAAAPATAQESPAESWWGSNDLINIGDLVRRLGAEDDPAARAAAAATTARAAAAVTRRINRRQYREALQAAALAVVAAREADQAVADATASGLPGAAALATGHARSARLAASAAVTVVDGLRRVHDEQVRAENDRSPVVTTLDELDFIVSGLRRPAPAREDELLLFDLDDPHTEPPAPGVAAPLREAGVFDLGIHADPAKFDLGGRVVTEAALAGWLLDRTSYGDDPTRMLRVNACSAACPDAAGTFELTLAQTLLNELIVQAWTARLDQVGGLWGPPDLIVTSPDPMADPRTWAFGDPIREALRMEPDEWDAFVARNGDRLRAMGERRFVNGGEDPRPVLFLPGEPPRRAELTDLDAAVVAAGLRTGNWTPPRAKPGLENMADRAEASARLAAGNAARVANLLAMLRRAAAQGNEALSPQAVKKRAWGLAQGAKRAAEEAARLAAGAERKDTEHWLGGPGARAVQAAANARTASRKAAELQTEVDILATSRSRERAKRKTKRAQAARPVLRTADELRAYLESHPPVEQRHPGEVRLYPESDTEEAARTLVAPVPMQGVTDVSMATDGRDLLYDGHRVAPEALAGYLFDRAAGPPVDGVSPPPVAPGPVRLNVCWAACPPSPAPDADLRDSLAGRVEKAMVAAAGLRNLKPADAVDLTAPADYLARRNDDDGDEWLDQALIRETGATPYDIARLRTRNGPDMEAAETRIGAGVGPDWPVWARFQPDQEVEIIRQRDLLGPPPGSGGEGDGGPPEPRTGPDGTEQYVQQPLPLYGDLGMAALTSAPAVSTSAELGARP